MYSKKDIILSIISGLGVGLISAPLFISLRIGPNIGNLWWLLVFILPILWVLGTYVGYKISKIITFSFQFSKFVAIGFLNTAIDFAIFNLFIILTGITKGFGLVLINSFSFLIAVTNSYFWNKGWTFSLGVRSKAFEFIQFVIVTLIGLLINNLILYSGTTFFHPLFGFDKRLWANLFKAIGAMFYLIWNFIGYKLIVFRKKNNE